MKDLEILKSAICTGTGCEAWRQGSLAHCRSFASIHWGKGTRAPDENAKRFFSGYNSAFHQQLNSEEEHLSPYCALMRLKEQGWKNLPCPRTIYNHLEYGDLHIDRTKLPHKPRGQKCKPKAPPRRAWKNPGNISIEERPESVATREEFGHWEMDTIVSCVGGRGGVLILVERQTRFAVTAKLNRLTKHDVLQALKKVRGEMKAIRSITTTFCKRKSTGLVRMQTRHFAES